MGTACPDMGRSLSQRRCSVRLVYLPSPRTHGVVARGSGILSPCPNHPTVPHVYQHAYQDGTDLRRSLLGAVSAQGLKSIEPCDHGLSVLAGGRRCVAVCADQEAWRGTDYEGGGRETG